MLPFLDLTSEFPDVRSALIEPNGLLAAGADLSTTRLVNAYSKGIFPWFSDDEPILWWSPNPRMVFQIQNFQPSRSLVRFVNKAPLKVTLNHAFESVINACAAPRKDQSGTWITDDIKKAYCELHRIGYAHSVEVWENNELVGGIYGIAIGKLFCGESMFSQIANSSKVALSTLIGYLRLNGFPILDCQVKNNHLISLGAVEIARDQFIDQLESLISLPTKPDIWRPKDLDPRRFVVRSSVTSTNTTSSCSHGI